MNEEDQALRSGCAHILSGHRTAEVRALLGAMAAHPMAGHVPDFYGGGGALAELEKRIAALLGKERALFFVNGVTAQMTVLRRHAELARTANIAIHPQSHIDVDEVNALERTAGLTPIRLGRYAPFTPIELQRVSDPVAAVVVELPLRRAGYLLPSLDELRAIAEHCQAREVALHLDGARLWEAAAGYDVALDELAALADSVYVSLYKGLGGLGGAVVAGTAEFVGSLATWKGRFGGNLFTAFPYALAGLAGLDRHLPQMPEYVARARALAGALGDDFVVHPARPHTNAFQLFLPATVAELAERNRIFARDRGVWLFNTIVEAPIAGHAIAEVVVGDNSDGFTIDQAADWITDFAGVTA